MLREPENEFKVEMYNQLKDKTVYESRFEFLKAHNGIRPNCLSGLMSSTGAGKSTLIKCIMTEVAMYGKKVLIWLSEETIIEYQELINFLDPSCLKNIVFVEEKEIKAEFRENQNDFFSYFEMMVEQSECDIVFIDNVTTSDFYDDTYGIHGQNKSAEFLREFTKRVCEIFYVAHTMSTITDNYAKIISPEDIRGSKKLPMMTEYFYIIQKFTSNNKQYNCLRTAKYRHHEDAAGWYSLTYENRAYIGDAKVPFNLINKIFKSRDYFGKAVKHKKADDKDKK